MIRTAPEGKWFIIGAWIIAVALVIAAYRADSLLWWGVVVVLVASVSFTGIGMMTAVLPLISPEKGAQLGFVAQGILLVVSGVYYPVEVLPGWMQAIAQISPATYALDGARAAILGSAWVISLTAVMAIPLGVAAGREVIVSRGEFVEIGAGFRLSDLIASTGARLREVGTTNRTNLADYADALGPDTGCLLKVHPSNFRVSGFTAAVPVAELRDLALARGVPLVVDVGSGLLRHDPALPQEPDLASALADGADVVIASGDKLLGGPQAGLLLGRAEVIQRGLAGVLVEHLEPAQQPDVHVPTLLRSHRPVQWQVRVGSAAGPSVVDRHAVGHARRSSRRCRAMR